MPMRRAAPWETTTMRPSAVRVQRARSSAALKRLATSAAVSPPGGSQMACSEG